MRRGLIGHTGFVGSNLSRQAAFDDFYNSRNIKELAGKNYDCLVCAGAPAQKWLANQNPAADRANLERLTHALARVQATQVILISTIDVYPAPIEVTEDTPIDNGGQQPYGKHRFELERFVRDRFETLIVRLPGLFGRGLKKNIVYDFLHNNGLEKVHWQSSFQFYDLENLWRDIEIALANRLSLINFATEPLAVHEVAAQVFDSEFCNAPNSGPSRYDFRTKHHCLYGGSDGYLYNRGQVLSAMADFVANERRPSAACHL